MCPADGTGFCLLDLLSPYFFIGVQIKLINKNCEA